MKSKRSKHMTKDDFGEDYVGLEHIRTIYELMNSKVGSKIKHKPSRYQYERVVGGVKLRIPSTMNEPYYQYTKHPVIFHFYPLSLFPEIERRVKKNMKPPQRNYVL